MKHYFELRSYDEARKVCLSCVEKWPDYWWSYLMLAKIESKLGDQSDAERRLAALAERWEDFFGYAFLAQFYFNRKEFEKSKQALQKALRPDPTRHKDQYAYEQIGSRESWVDDCYYHNAAYMAYRMGDRQLCLAICDRWKGFVKEVQHYGGEEERALRIVCAVNDTDWDRAKDLLEAMKQPPEYAPWQDEGIHRLGDVIRSKCTEYVYDPKLFRNAGAPIEVEFNYK
jgi:tetratricopeptide (TPR) repeat protein